MVMENSGFDDYYPERINLTVGDTQYGLPAP